MYIAAGEEERGSGKSSSCLTLSVTLNEIIEKSIA